MANSTLTEKQREFCKLFITGKSGADAYSIAFNSNNQSNCKVNASKLLKSDKIKSYISELQAENKKIVEMANNKAAQDLADGSIATATERMQILTKIMRGEIPLIKPMVVDKQLVDIEVVPDYSDRRAAIAELNKMDGSYAPAKQDITTNGKDLPQTTIQIGYGPKRKD